MAPKKKLSKKEKARLEAEQAELLRVELEKEKHKKLEAEKQRKLKEHAQAQKRQQQEIVENKIRRQQLKDSMEFFHNIETVIDGILDKEKENVEWSKFMRCNGLPMAHSPGDLRKYIHMWINTTKEQNQNERNWLLQTDERTLLTHDTSIPDLSQATLRKQQGEFGEMYTERTREVLFILQEVDDAIQNHSLSEEIVKDLNKLKIEIREFLKEFINDFTYRILSHVDRDMELDKPGVFKHVYQSDVFKSQILTMKGKPVQQTKGIKARVEEPQHTEIDYTLLDMQVSYPPTIKLTNSSTRVLWLNYDHFSDYCFSYQLPIKRKEQLNMLLQTKKEWKKRKEILQSMLDEATKETPQNMFDTLDPPEQRVIDVDKLYTQHEDELNKARRKTIGPEALNLGEFDVNLRKYRIIAGVFAIDLLELPQQDKRLNAKSFIRTIKFPNKLKNKTFHQTYKPPPPPVPGVRRLPEEIEAEMRMVEMGLDKLALVSVQLPESVLWFEPPIVVRWETPEESEESFKLEKSLGPQRKSVTYQLSPTKSSRRQSSIRQQSFQLPIKNVEDFDMCNIPADVDIYDLMKSFILPRLPYGFCIRLEKSQRKHKKISYLYIARNRELSSHDYTIKQATVNDIIFDSGSPREFHTEIEFNQILKVVKQNEQQDGSYMFSQLVEDLDKLCEAQYPLIIHEQISEICSHLSSPRSEETTPIATPVRRFSGLIIIRESDIPPKTTAVEDIDSDSHSEYEDIEDAAETDFDESLKQNGNDINLNRLGKWSLRDIHDTKFNEDKLSIQYRTGRMGIFGFGLNRYTNMPYQTWEIKPDIKNPGTILFSLTASVVSLDMSITTEGYCVNNFQGGTTNTLEAMIGQTMSMNELKRILINSAVDIFPEDDAFCYTEGSCEKNYVMEMHLYNCMSALGQSHNFTWSRWNLLSGSRTAVLLMRELIENKKIPNHSTLLVTPMSTSVIECTEVSQSFNTIGIEGMQFYADLYQLAKVHALPSSLEKMNTMDPMLRNNIANILRSTRPLSFC